VAEVKKKTQDGVVLQGIVDGLRSSLN